MAMRRRAGGTLGDVAAADSDPAGGDGLEPGDHPQQRRLAAAGGAEQGAELARLDGEAEVGDHLDGAEALVQAVELDVRHRRLLSPRGARPPSPRARGWPRGSRGWR